MRELDTNKLKEEYYTQYQKIIDEVKQQYGIELSLQPIEQFDEQNMMSPEEFKIAVLKNYETLNNLSVEHNITRENSINGIELYTYENTDLYSTYGVKISFTAGINVLKHPETNLYFIESFTAFKPTTSSSKPNVAVVVDSYNTSIIDGGRTHVIRCDFTLTVEGVNYSKTEAAYYYLNRNTGVITMSNL